MVNTQILKDHISKFKITQQTAGQFYRQLFTVCPSSAEKFDAEDIDPDSIPKSRKFQMMGSTSIKEIFGLPFQYEENKWGGSVRQMAEYYMQEQGMKYDEFKKIPDAVVNMMKEHAEGGCSDAQKNEWMALFEEAFKITDEKYS